MKKRLICLFLVLILTVSSVFAAQWWDGKDLKSYEVTGTENIVITDITGLLFDYKNQPLSNSVINEIQNKLYSVKGVDWLTISLAQEGDGARLIVQIFELPTLDSIEINGCWGLKSDDVLNEITEIKVGDFYDSSTKGLTDAIKKQVENYYKTKGYKDVQATVNFAEVVDDDSKVLLTIEIVEGIQTRISSISFEGNANVGSSTLKKKISSAAKTLFNSGYYNATTIESDKDVIASYYQTLGYIDVVVSDVKITAAETQSSGYNDVNLTFVIEEGDKWYYDQMIVTGNSIYSNAVIDELLTIKHGTALNLSDVESQYTAIQDLYMDNGYMFNGWDMQMQRNTEDNTVTFYFTISEGPQAVIEDIWFTGLENTEEYVMRRELEIEAGDVFSKSKFITSAQNLYNTGLLEDLTYQTYQGSSDNSIIIEFVCTEGSHMDLQFGATFGGNVDGFPVSGFVSWSENNLLGTARELSVSSTISPDTQSISVTFADDWFKDLRWSNSISFSFSHTKETDQLQRATGEAFYDGRNDDSTHPLGTTLSQWIASSNAYPSENYLMDYDMLTASLSYTTGYTFIFDIGRLSFSTGLSIGLNYAVYDEKYEPYEKLIYKYGQQPQFSNKFSLSLSWDGRDYVNNTTKGYVISANVTYAGGFLMGLSNYIQTSGSASFYFKLAEIGLKDNKKNLMLCATTTVSTMFDQYSFDVDEKTWAWRDARLGATRYEMLYIDGMTTARGFNSVLDLSFVWDNMLEISYPLSENVLQAEAFASATGVSREIKTIKNGLDWYFAAGVGVKLKISGFPLGCYLVKNATYTNADGFNWKSGSIFHKDDKPNSGMSFVLAISTSLI